MQKKAFKEEAAKTQRWKIDTNTKEEDVDDDDDDGIK